MAISAREKTILAAGAVVAVIFAVVQFGLVPSDLSLRGGSERLALAQKRLRQEKELVAGADRVSAQLTTLKTSLAEQEKRLLPNTDANQAAAQLQQMMVQRATEQKLDVVRSDFPPSAPYAEVYVKVPVRMELTGGIAQTVQFLTNITQGERLAAIETLQISNYGPEKDKQVRCVVVVSGLMAKPS